MQRHPILLSVVVLFAGLLAFSQGKTPAPARAFVLAMVLFTEGFWVCAWLLAAYGWGCLPPLSPRGRQRGSVTAARESHDWRGAAEEGRVPRHGD